MPFTKLDEALREFNQDAGASEDTTVTKRGKNNVVLPPAFIQQLFDPIMHKIDMHVASLLARFPEIKVIFLVGGFSESGVLQGRIKTRFETAGRKLVIPSRPGLSVLRGAVKFGRDTSAFALRKARHTYGVGHSTSFDPTNPVHVSAANEDITVLRKNGIPTPTITNMFSKFVTKGADLEADEVVTETFSPCHDGQTSVSFPLFMTPLKNPERICRREMRQVGTITCGSSGSINDSIACKLVFGSTEMKLSAYNTTTGQAVAANINYTN